MELAKIAVRHIWRFPAARRSKTLRVVYDRNAGIGQIPENLKPYLNDPNLYQMTYLRGRPAIVRASA